MSPLAISALAGRAMAEHLAAEAGDALARVAPHLLPKAPSNLAEAPETDVPDAEPPDAANPGPEPVVSDVAVAAVRRSGTHAPPAPATASPGSKGVFVSAQAVLRLANARAIPDGRPVPADGARPAGVQLSGVGGLGIGMRDGDVLTTAAGAPVRSKAQVIGLVASALGKGAETISGSFWRDGERYNLVVRVPVPRAGGASGGRTSQLRQARAEPHPGALATRAQRR